MIKGVRYRISTANGTTPIYTHVSNKDFMRIRNPLDQILEEKKGG